MDMIILIGRILLSLIFLGSGVAHLTQPDGIAPGAASKGVPRPKLVVQLSGAAWTVCGLAVVLGIWADLALLAITILLIVVTLVMHRFWNEEGEARQHELTQFLKNLSIAGGSFALFGFFADGYDRWQLVAPALNLT